MKSRMYCGAFYDINSILKLKVRPIYYNAADLDYMSWRTVDDLPPNPYGADKKVTARWSTVGDMMKLKLLSSIKPFKSEKKVRTNAAVYYHEADGDLCAFVQLTNNGSSVLTVDGKLRIIHDFPIAQVALG